MNTNTYNETLQPTLDSYGLLNKVSLAFVLLFIFLIPWGDGLYDGLPALAGMASVGLLSFVFISEGVRQNYSLYHLFVVLLWSWVLISLIWTPDYEVGIEVAKRSIQLMLLPFVFTLILTNIVRLNYAYQSFVLGNIVGSSIIIYNYLNGIESVYYNRYGITNLEPDLLGVMLALSIPLAAYLSSQSDNKLLKILNTLGIPLIIYAIFLTGTRTASLLMFLGIGYWLFTYRKSSLQVKASIFILFLMSIILVISFAPKASLERAISSKESISTGTLNYRTVIWGASVNQWMTKPIVGTGLGSLGSSLSRENVQYAGAHNAYLEFLTENGIIGLALYILLLITILYQILHCPFQEKVFFLSIFFVITISQFVQHSHIQKETWFLLTMIAIHSRFYSRLQDNH